MKSVSPLFLEEISEKIQISMKGSLESHDDRSALQSAMYLLRYYKFRNPNRRINLFPELIEPAVERCKEHMLHGFSKGTMGTVFCFLNMYELSGDSKFLDLASNVSYFFNEYLGRNQSMDNGTSGTLLGYLYLHSVSKKDWILDDINIYVNHLIDRLVIAKEGFLLAGEPLRSGNLNACFVFIKIAKYLGNKSFLKIALELYSYEIHNYSEPDSSNDKNIFWGNWHFSFGVASAMLYLVTTNAKYLTNLKKACSSLNKSATLESLIHLYYLKQLENSTLDDKDRLVNDQIMSRIVKDGISDKYPDLYQRMTLEHYLPKYYKQLNPYGPNIPGRIESSKKHVPLFKNVLSISEADLAERIMNNNAMGIY